MIVCADFVPDWSAKLLLILEIPQNYFYLERRFFLLISFGPMWVKRWNWLSLFGSERRRMVRVPQEARNDIIYGFLNKAADNLSPDQSPVFTLGLIKAPIPLQEKWRFF